jgi:UDP-N-acetylmuramoylalanine--D-glutamate ligase
MESSMTVNMLNYRKVIVGLGMSGLSCARYLHHRQEAFMVVDSRESPPCLDQLRREMPNVPVILGEIPESILLEAEELLLSPGVDPRQQAIRSALSKGVRASGDIDIFSHQCHAPIIAVTGSNAKSTVVTLVGELLQAAGCDCAVAGNIGKPVLELLEEPKKQFYVLELSSFQLETTQNLQAHVATVLNMSPDHMDRYDSMQAYHSAKHRVFRGCRQVVVNREDSLSRPLLPAKIRQTTFGLDTPDIGQFGTMYVNGECYLAKGKQTLLPASKLKMLGMHNVINALAALALVDSVGIDVENPNLLSVLESFGGLKHRCQWLGQKNGVGYYNDSKGTNVGATIAAINGLAAMTSGRILLIAGGIGKGQDFSGLREPIIKNCRALITMGQDGSKISNLIKEDIAVFAAASMQEAVELASALSQSGDAVLLSPACASFDMFADYVERGDVFAACVKEVLK